MARAKKSKNTQGEENQMTQTVTEVTSEPTSPSAPIEVITLQDLSLLAAIVNLAAKRGAFQANEMAQVGNTYDKLVNFLKQISSAQEVEQEKSEEE